MIWLLCRQLHDVAHQHLRVMLTNKRAEGVPQLLEQLGVKVTQERLADVIRMSDRKAMQRAEAATAYEARTALLIDCMHFTY